MSGQARVKKVLEGSLELRARLAALVDSFPYETGGVRRLDKNCCSVSLSTIQENGGILAPEYYLTATAKDRLKAIFQETSLRCLDDKIKEILATGWISERCLRNMHGLSVKNRIKACPGFLAALDKLWHGEEDETK
jgi:hypothetical protein